MIVYAFLYNGCVHESSYATMSLHKTEAGAIAAMTKHKEKCLEEYYKAKLDTQKDYENDETLSDEDRNFLIEHNQEDTFGVHQDWYITTMELLD